MCISGSREKPWWKTCLIRGSSIELFRAKVDSLNVLKDHVVAGKKAKVYANTIQDMAVMVKELVKGAQVRDADKKEGRGCFLCFALKVQTPGGRVEYGSSCVKSKLQKLQALA